MARVETDRQDRVDQAIREAEAFLARLEPLLVESDGSGPDTGTIGRHAPESSEPWSKAAASAYWDLYFGAGNLARGMRSAAGLKLPLFKDTYGPEALAIVRNMAPTASDTVMRWVLGALDKWIDQARQVPDVDESEPWVPMPRRPNGQPLACPYCKTFGLRMLRRKGEVRCIFPDCRDGDGNPTRARMEPGRMTGEERLVFGDGTTMGGGDGT
jgi:hypothetical protein